MTEKIKRTVNEIRNKFPKHSVSEICQELGICIIYANLPSGMNGFFYSVNDKKAIIIDPTNEKMKDYFLAHELAHALFHEQLNRVFIKEKTDFVLGRYEREADLFAAFLLLGDSVSEEAERIAVKNQLPETVVKNWLNATKERLAV